MYPIPINVFQHHKICLWLDIPNFHNKVKAPVAILGGKTDIHSPPELFKQFEKILSYKPEV